VAQVAGEPEPQSEPEVTPEPAEPEAEVDPEPEPVQRRTESLDEWAARLHAMLEKSKPLARPGSDPAEEDDFEELEEVEEELVA
jgi:hypothetical protein